MAEQDPTQVRPPEPIVITISRARYLRGTKGDTLTVMVKAEFSERLLGESPKVECTPDAPAEFNFSTSLNCSFEDPSVLDEIAHKPVVLTFTEVLPKERRQKEEKTNLLGQCSMDLLPLVKGEKTVNYTLVINPLPGSPLDSLPPEHSRPEVDVMLRVNEALLDEQQMSEGNLMTITVESLFSVPETWQLTGPQYYYSASLPVPYNMQREVTVVFPGGQLKPGADKELPNKQKKWAATGAAVANSVYIPDSFISSDPVEEEDGDFKDKEDREHRQVSENEKLRLTWNTERRCYLEPSAVKGFKDSVAKNRYWPVEIFRLPQPSGSKSKKEDEGTISFHGVALLNFAPLLYPGVKRIRGAYKVLPYTDNLLLEKANRRSGIAEEAARLALSQLNRSSASPAPKKGGSKEPDRKDTKKGTSTMLKSDTGSEADNQSPVNVEGQQYADAKSYVMIEVFLASPMVPKRPPEEMARRVAELIPPRPAFPRRTDCADKAVEDYHGQIASVAALILEEFREMFGPELNTEVPPTSEVMEEKRQKLMYQLNTSGKYFSFKEQLKHAVIKIVREKYLKTSNFGDRQQLQTFLSELYVYLVDQMHVSLNKVLQIEDQPPIPEPLTTNAQLKHFAREAEVNKDFELATKYYQERIIREESNADNWFDYGIFCLYINNVAKAEECLHKCISINQRHMDGLMLYGIVCAMAEKNEAAETFFEAATNVDPKNVLAWTLMGLFYDSLGSDIGAEMAFLEANRLNIQQAREAEQEKERKEKEKEKEKVTESTDSGPVEQSNHFSIDRVSVPATDVKQLRPASESTQASAPSSVRGARLSGSKTGGLPASQLKSLTPSRPGSLAKTSFRGSPIMDGHEEEDTPPHAPTPVPAMTIFMQAIEWLLEVKAIPFAEMALAHELLMSTGGRTTAFHIATAHLKLQKEKYDEAEESLSQAVQMDHQNPDGWALMGHVKYLSGDNTSARDCYERTLSFITDASETHSIYLRLASIYLQQEEFAKAKHTFLMACKRSPSSMSWLGVGIACYRLEELGEAEDALMEANILNNTDAQVWAYLSMVCLRTGRKVEAEQSYKYAIKLQLQDPDLLSEIQEEQKKAGFGSPEF